MSAQDSFWPFSDVGGLTDDVEVAARPGELMIRQGRRNIPCANLERYRTSNQ
jgi:hypothetical protein